MEYLYLDQVIFTLKWSFSTVEITIDPLLAVAGGKSCIETGVRVRPAVSQNLMHDWEPPTAPSNLFTVD